MKSSNSIRNRYDVGAKNDLAFKQAASPPNQRFKSDTDQQIGRRQNDWGNNLLNEFMKIEAVNHHIEQFKNATQHLDPADERLKKLDIDFVRKLSRIIETHPDIKSGESKYIAENALLIASGLEMSPEEKGDLLYAGLLIQLGKMNLSDKLLKRPFDVSTLLRTHG